jgi:hypothetical protein
MKQAFLITYRPIDFIIVSSTLLINIDKNRHISEASWELTSTPNASVIYSRFRTPRKVFLSANIAPHHKIYISR